MSVEGIPNKLKAIFYGPGWFPGTPRLGDNDQLPEVIDFSTLFEQEPWWLILEDIIHQLFLVISENREGEVCSSTFL